MEGRTGPPEVWLLLDLDLDEEVVGDGGGASTWMRSQYSSPRVRLPMRVVRQR